VLQSWFTLGMDDLAYGCAEPGGDHHGMRVGVLKRECDQCEVKKWKKRPVFSADFCRASSGPCLGLNRTVEVPELLRRLEAADVTSWHLVWPSQKGKILPGL
jgi:hypothetical protein